MNGSLHLTFFYCHKCKIHFLDRRKHDCKQTKHLNNIALQRTFIKEKKKKQPRKQLKILIYTVTQGTWKLSLHTIHRTGSPDKRNKSIKSDKNISASSQ